MPSFYLFIYQLAGGLMEMPEFEPIRRTIYKDVPPEQAEAHWRKKHGMKAGDDYFPVKVVRISETTAQFLLHHYLATKEEVEPPIKPFAPPPAA